jgi:RimJ/RimL family protein N-acetyltransferase
VNRRTPALESERLIVRELTMDDLGSINDVLNRATGSDTPADERRRWLQWTVLGYEMFAMLQQPHFGERAIVLKGTADIIGAVGTVPYLDVFTDVEALARSREAMATSEVGMYWAIDPAHQGRGYATEAARALVDYMFSHERLERIIATAGRDNRSSQQVMRKLGMAIYRLEEPRPPDLFVVGVLENHARQF